MSTGFRFRLPLAAVAATALVFPGPAAGPAPGAAQPAVPFRDSLPRTSGTASIAGLAAPVTVERDWIGVPVMTGGTLEDVVRAQGFVHAQERFFQMDMMRRLAAGRLAEVTGSILLSSDRHYRRYRMESVATQIIARMPAAERRLLEVYAEGVNAGLADLGASPPEYVLLQVEPAPWRSADTLLVLYSMFDALNFNAAIERRLGVMAETLPEELYRFLTPATNRFDAPLIRGDAAAPPGAGDRGYRPRPIPPPAVVDLRTRSGARPAPDLVETRALALGSNNWAVAGTRTTHGGALLANDPHLQITAPGIWFRCELAWGAESGREPAPGAASGPAHRGRGVSLPGTPGIIIGATDHLAWGFTNSMGDFQDLVIVEVDPDDPGRYRTPDGFEAFGEIVEDLAVRGGRTERLTLRSTRWGVVTGADARGRPLVLKWTALHPEMVNFNVLRMLNAETLEEGVRIARSWYGPSQNTLIADAGGRIAWVVSGYFPRRVGFDGSVPVSWARPGVGWDGPLDESRRPVVVDPADGILYTANNRTVDEGWAHRLGNTWALGARARRIESLLRAKEKLDESDLAAIQLDTRVEVLDPYRDLVIETTRDAEAGGLLAAARRIAADWNGTADTDQAAVRILDAYRSALHRALIGPLVAACRKRDPDFRYHWFADEEPVRRLLETRPDHLLPPGSASWDDLFRATLVDVLESLAGRTPEAGLAVPWGDVNRAMIHHPLAGEAPAFAAMLNMPDDPLPGHPDAVRVATPVYGASLRLVVSPSFPERGLLQIPAGQSGHPMSPHYRDSHPTWLKGLPTPLMAGRGVSRFSLVPGE